MGLIDGRFEKNIATDAVDTVLNLGRAYSLWPVAYGLACCAIEMIHTMTARWDLAFRIHRRIWDWPRIPNPDTVWRRVRSCSRISRTRAAPLRR